MAQKVLIQLTSDLSGEVIEDGKGETVAFSVDNTAFEIDLSNKEAAALRKSLDKYVSAARKVGRKTGTAGRRSSSTGGSGMSKEELANVRAWAKDNGYEVSERGRIKQDVIEAYHAANG